MALPYKGGITILIQASVSLAIFGKGSFCVMCHDDILQMVKTLAIHHLCFATLVLRITEFCGTQSRLGCFLFPWVFACYLVLRLLISSNLSSLYNFIVKCNFSQSLALLLLWNSSISFLTVHWFSCPVHIYLYLCVKCWVYKDKWDKYIYFLPLEQICWKNDHWARNSKCDKCYADT